MNTRIYLVTDGEASRLVEAANPAQALRHCAAQRFTVKAARAQDVATLMGRGVAVECVQPEQQEIAA